MQKTYGQTFLFLDLCGRLLAGGLNALKLAEVPSAKDKEEEGSGSGRGGSHTIKVGSV